MSHEARQLPAWLIFDVRQAKRGQAKRGVEGGNHGERSLRVNRFSDFTLVGSSGADFLVGMRGLGVVRLCDRTAFPPSGRMLEPVGGALVVDRAP